MHFYKVGYLGSETIHYSIEQKKWFTDNSSFSNILVIIFMKRKHAKLYNYILYIKVK